MFDNSLPNDGKRLSGSTDKRTSSITQVRVAAAAAVVVVALLLAAPMFTAAFAQTVTTTSQAGLKFIGTPEFTIEDNVITATGEVSGAGTGGEATLTATADVIRTCTNRGGNDPPGQERQTVSVAGQVQFDTSKSGRGTFTVSAEVGDVFPDCPDNMDKTIDVEFISAELVVTALNNPNKVATATVIF